MVRRALGGRSVALLFGSGHERAPVSLLVLLLVQAVGDVFADVLILLRLAPRTVEIAPTASSPEAWLVAKSRSCLVVCGPFHPSLWTGDS
jgi:hypothetical protein